MNGDPQVYELLNRLNIPFEYIEHPSAPTIDIAKQYWQGHDAQHCKNIFLRNHKGNRHYLVILDCDRDVKIADLEKRLKQGKLTFASPHRMQLYLGLEAGSVSPFGLIHDVSHHVHLFIDENLKKVERISFHPNLNTASLIISFPDFLKFLEHCGNTHEFIQLYE